MLLDHTGAIEPSVAWELFQSKGKRWFESGWSLDAVATTQKVGLGIAKDIFKNQSIEIDVGGYLLTQSSNLLKGKINPMPALGMHISF